MKANQEIEMNKTPPMKFFFWMSETINYAQSGNQDVNYIDLLFWILVFFIRPTLDWSIGSNCLGLPLLWTQVIF